jgi:hypothetical protein
VARVGEVGGGVGRIGSVICGGKKKLNKKKRKEIDDKE